MTKVPIGTVAERYDRGTRLRKKVPREKHADLLGSANRDPVVILAEGDRMRLPKLIPVRNWNTKRDYPDDLSRLRS